jgi:DnaJ-class molecular chaperone
MSRYLDWCDECKGEGFCQACEGTGMKVVIQALPCDHCRYTPKRCPRCEGAKKIWWEDGQPLGLR